MMPGVAERFGSAELGVGCGRGDEVCGDAAHAMHDNG